MSEEKQYRINIRFTKEHYDTITNLSKAKGLNRSAYLRNMILERLRKVNGLYNNSVMQELKDKMNNIAKELNIDKKERKKTVKLLEKQESKITPDMIEDLDSKKEILFNVFRGHQSTDLYKFNTSQGNPTPLHISDIMKKTKFDRATIYALTQKLFKNNFKEIGTKGGLILIE